MSFFNSLNVAASGLTAQQIRMDVITENIANVDTTRAKNGEAYKRKVVLFQERVSPGSFMNELNKAMGASASAGRGYGVRASSIEEDQTPGAKRYEPNHPDADAQGYVTMPNVNIVTEMVNMISASRSYEAGVTAMNGTKAMMAKTLEISGK